MNPRASTLRKAWCGSKVKVESTRGGSFPGGSHVISLGSSREGFGGGVSVTGDSKGTATTPKGGKGSGQSSGGRNQDGRGRSQSGRRSLDKTKGSK